MTPDVSTIDDVKLAHTEVPIHELIERRWSPRSFSDRAVSPADLKTLFTAAGWAASSQNEQPWRFIVGVKGDETYRKLFASLLPGNQMWAGVAPVLFATFAKKTFSANNALNGSALHDTGAASATLSLQAQALGLHTHGMAGVDKELLRAFFGIPSDFDVVAVWALGYLGDPHAVPDKYKQAELDPRTRKPLGEFVFSTWERPAEF